MAEALYFLHLLEAIENGGNVRRERRFADRQDPLDHHDEALIQRFRLPRQAILDLCAVLEPTLRRRTRRSRAIPVHIQVSAALRFYASGSFQNVVADTVGIGKTSCCTIIRDVTNALVAVAGQYISFPNNLREQASVKAGFNNLAGFPNIVGAIDCTHVEIRAPSVDEHLYVNRRSRHSINCQVICDATLRIMDVVARWPGSTHDSFIWNQCALKRDFDGGLVPNPGWLIGRPTFISRIYTNVTLYTHV